RENAKNSLYLQMNS
nr:immunoglobulin heavy chain junction region [Homo sapiens]